MSVVDEENSHVITPKQWGTFGVTMAMSFISSVVVVILNPLLPLLATEFGLSASDVGWVFTVTAVAAAGSILVLPRMADVIGDRRTMVIAGVLLTVGALIPGLVSTYAAVLVGVAVFSAGCAAALLGYALLARHASGMSTKFVTGSVTAAGGLGVGAGLLIGGLALETFNLSLGTVFIGVAIFSGISTVAAQLLIPGDKGVAQGGLGVANIVLGLVWVGALLYGFSQIAPHGLLDVRAYGFLLGSLVLAAIWVRQEKRAEMPTIDMALFGLSVMRRGAFGLVVLGISMTALFYVVPFIAQLPKELGGLGLTTLGTGLLLIPWSVLYLLGGAMSGVLGGMSAQARAALAFAVLTVASLSMAFAHDSIWTLGAALAGLGLAQAMVTATIFEMGLTSVSEDKAGMASTFLGLTQTLGGAAIVPVFAYILEAREVPGVPGVPADSQFTLSLLMVAAVGVVGVLTYTLLGRVKSEVLD